MNGEPLNPDKYWMMMVKRQRFCKIMREGKRICRLEPEERDAVVALCERIEKRTGELIRDRETLITPPAVKAKRGKVE